MINSILNFMLMVVTQVISRWLFVSILLNFSHCFYLISDYLSFHHQSEPWNIMHRDIVVNLTLEDICKVQEPMISLGKVFCVLPYHICLQILVSNIFTTAETWFLHCQIFFRTDLRLLFFSKLWTPFVTIFSGYCLMNEAEYMLSMAICIQRTWWPHCVSMVLLLWGGIF